MSKVHLVGLLSSIMAFVIFAVPFLVPTSRLEAQQVLLAGLALGLCLLQVSPYIGTRRRQKRQDGAQELR